MCCVCHIFTKYMAVMGARDVGMLSLMDSESPDDKL